MNTRSGIVVVGLFGALLAIPSAARAEDPPRLLSVKKIWDAGKHNAFTDLIRWRDRWYCSFREAEAHVGGDGQVRVLTSTDGDRWESLALIGETGIDLRDPKLSVTPDDRLMIVAGGSVYRGGKILLGRQPRVMFSLDGAAWSAPARVLEEGDWLWRVTWHQGKAYGIAYDAGERQSAAARKAAESHQVAEPGPADWKLKLVVSDDGVNYRVLQYLDVPGHPNETTLRFTPEGELIALIRREGGDTLGWIGTSRPPYNQWSYAATSYRLGGPNFLILPQGGPPFWASTRVSPGGAKTVLARMTRSELEPVLTLPSGGDTSYAGMVWHDGVLWMSYYSSHERKSSIYLARIALPELAGRTGQPPNPGRNDGLADRR